MIGATGPKISSLMIRASAGTPSSTVGRVEVAGPVGRRATGDQLGAVCTASVTSRPTESTASALISGPTSVPEVCPRPVVSAPMRALRRSANSPGHRLVDQEAVGGRARLAHVAHLRDHGAVDGGGHVGVLEDDERRVAAELHGDPLEHVCGLADDHLPDRGRAR